MDYAQWDFSGVNFLTGSTRTKSYSICDPFGR